MKKFIFKRSDYISAAASAVLIFSIVSVLTPIFEKNEMARMAKEISAEKPAPESPFAKLALSAKAIYVYDAKTGKELFSQNGDAQLPLASLVKIMTTVAALNDALPATAVEIDKNIIPSAKSTGPKPGEKWTLKNLLEFTLIQSSNEGASMVASAIGALNQNQNATDTSSSDISRLNFVGEMNREARTLGLAQTFFINENGLDASAETAGAYGSARDAARLFAYAIAKYPDIFEGTKYDGVEIKTLDSKNGAKNADHLAINTNKFINAIPGLIASKTGTTDLAGGNLVIAFDAGPARPIVISLLGGTADGRFSDAEQLVWATLEYIKETGN